MQTVKNAALLGLAAGDSMLFAPVAPAAPTQQYGQMASAPVYAPAAQPIEYVQPVEYVEAPAVYSQFWLWTGAGALAMVGAAAAARNGQTSAVAALDEEDLEVARVATLAVKGKKEEPWSLTSFLMGGRKSFRGENTGELELLSGVTKPKSDEPGQLASRFKIGYDTRSRNAPKAKAKAKATGRGVTAWRSKNQQSNLYPGKK